MSAPAGFTEQPAWERRLPARFRPRASELAGSGRQRRLETAVLVLVALLLAVATVNDVLQQTNVNHRLIADLRTWREYTGHDYKNVSVEEDLYGHTTRDFACGNITPGPPKERTQICLTLTGPIRDGRRAALGGWYLPPKSEDLRRYRYGCYGSAKIQGLCER
jgi:hypothetical protein